MLTNKTISLHGLFRKKILACEVDLRIYD